MITSEFTDKDGFKLQFDEACTESDKKFFREQYPKVDLVANQKLHCTTCDVHIGTAPISEKIIRTHQALGVTQCNKCFAFYNSGEFGKGEDGSEYYCRWCGQGGEVFCCSTCPFVFCNKCIRGNLTQSYVKEIEETDDWSCFVCDKSILQKHRGHHWALRNFMNKQLEKIQKINITSEDDLNNLLNEDVATCCPRRKRKSLLKPSPAPVKRPSMNGAFTVVQPPAKKIILQQAPARPAKSPASTNSYRPQSTPAKPGQPGKKNDEIVCTPDILGLFNDNNEDNAIPSANMVPSTSLAPPPLVMRNNPRPVRPQGNAPIYHNVNGFQIDLNHAARQEIFRLPNGKLIQVRKQSGPPTSSTPRPGMPLAAAPRGPQFTIRQANAANAAHARANFGPRIAPQIRQRFNLQPQTRFTFSEGRVVAQPMPTAPAPSTPSASTVFTQQNGSISVARAPQPNTPFGTAKTEFEDKIISGMEICQHTINKMITLTNSTSFKTSGNFKDLKDLYIHLQYLFTYTSGKFNTLQESLKTGMESLAKHDDKLKDKADDDELEIVEEKQDVIEVMSDDDEPPPKEKEKSPIAALVKKPLLKHIQYTKDSETAEAGQEKSEAVVEGLKIVKDGSGLKKIELDLGEMLEKDKKLRNRVMVKVEKLENSKNPIIKQYIRQLHERLEKESSDESREGTPESIFEPMVCLEEDVEKEPETAVTSSEMENTETFPVETLPEAAEEAVKELESAENVVEVPSEDEDAEDINETLTAPEAMEVDSEETQTKARSESTGEDKIEDEMVEDEIVEDENVEDEKIEDKKIEVPEKNESSADVETVGLDDSLQDITETDRSLEKPENAMETGEKSEESEEKPEENQEKVEKTQEKSEKTQEIIEKSPENVENSLENTSKVVEKSEEIQITLDDSVEILPNTQDSVITVESSDVSQTCLDLTEDIQSKETFSELPQASIDTVTENDFIDCPTNGSSLKAFENTEITPLSEKNGENLPTIEEVAKLVANEIDDEKAMLENLFNELENKSTAMEVD